MFIVWLDNKIPNSFQLTDQRREKELTYSYLINLVYSLYQTYEYYDEKQIWRCDKEFRNCW